MNKKRFGTIIPLATIIVVTIAFLLFPFTQSLVKEIDWIQIFFPFPRNEYTSWIYLFFEKLSLPRSVQIIAGGINAVVACHLIFIINHTVLVAENYQAISSPMFFKLFLVFYLLSVGSIFLGILNGYLIERALVASFTRVKEMKFILNWVVLFSVYMWVYHIAFQFFSVSKSNHRELREAAVRERIEKGLPEQPHIY